MEPFVHALIPLAFLLALFPSLDKKYALSLVPIVWILDLDTFIGIHRFTFHNIFFVLALAGIVYIIWKNKTAFWVTLYYGFSHLILDLSNPGSAWFYPIIKRTFYFEASITHIKTWAINLDLGSLSLAEYNTLFESLIEKTYVGEASFLFLLLFSVILTAYLITKKHKKKTPIKNEQKRK